MTRTWGCQLHFHGADEPKDPLPGAEHSSAGEYVVFVRVRDPLAADSHGILMDTWLYDFPLPADVHRTDSTRSSSRYGVVVVLVA